MRCACSMLRGVAITGNQEVKQRTGTAYGAHAAGRTRVGDIVRMVDDVSVWWSAWVACGERRRAIRAATVLEDKGPKRRACATAVAQGLEGVALATAESRELMSFEGPPRSGISGTSIAA